MARHRVIGALRGGVAEETVSDPNAKLLAILEKKLEEVRAEGNERAEEIVLDFMCIVTGWCAPHVRLRCE